MVYKERDNSNNNSSNTVVIVFRAIGVVVMGCLFGCFKVKDTKESFVSRNSNPLSSLFTEEKDETDISGCNEVENESPGTAMPQLDTNELRNQAKFLKACGTLPETPAEIRNGLVKCKDLLAPVEEVEPLKFNSWASDATFQKLNPNSLPDQPTPTKTDGVAKQSGSLVQTPSSCLTDGDGQSGKSFSRSSISRSGNSNTPTSMEVISNLAHNGNRASAASPITAPTAQYRYKSVRFESESDLSSMSSKYISSETSQDSGQSDTSGNYNASKNSPYPTPLKLTDEMQTPGTVFPAYLDNLAIAKTARIRSQYVYPILNPVDDASQLKELSDEDSYSTQDSTSRFLSSHTTDSDQRTDEDYFMSGLGMSKCRKSSADKESKFIDEVHSMQHFGSVYGEKVHYGKTSGDRPIIGLVATHWNDDETSSISPKWWDGNGIPNSTNKYKEDQKVRWHATPFEERLEKALSQETNVSERNQLSGMPPIAFNETEESDTPTSQMHK